MRVRGVLAAAALLNAGCASVLSKSDWPVRFTSDQPGLAFEVIDEYGNTVVEATTPHTAVLASSAGYMDGMNYIVRFAGRERFLDAEMNEVTVVNLVIPFVGYLGILIVDPLTGCMWKMPEICRLIIPRGSAEPSPE